MCDRSRGLLNAERGCRFEGSERCAGGRSMRDINALCTTILAAARKGRRRIVALAGAPASGKSTLAEELANGLVARGCEARVLPMDGFHLGNSQLRAQGSFSKKGAPQTFDVAGFLSMVARVQTEDEVYYPVFDRRMDAAITADGLVDDACDTVIIEGNYLLYDADKWRELVAFWDVSVRLKVPMDVLEQRLVDRWLAHGLTPEAALARSQENDLVNARLIETHELPADYTVE